MKMENGNSESLLNPILKTFFVFGFYNHNGDRDGKLKRYMYSLYRTSIATLLWMNVVRLSFAYFEINERNIQWSNVSMVHAAYLLGAANFTICWVKLGDGSFRNIFNEMNNLPIILQISNKTQTKLRFIILTLLSLDLVAILLTVIYTAYLFTETEVFDFCTVPFTMTSPIKILILKISILCIEWYWMCGIFLPCILPLGICWILRTYLQDMAIKFRNLQKQDQLEAISSLRRDHQLVCKIVYSLDASFNFMSLVSMSVTFFTILTSVYQMVWNKNLLDSVHKMITYGIITGSFFMMLLVQITVPALLHETAHELSADMHDLSVAVEPYSPEFAEIQMFLTRLNGPDKIGLTAFGFFLLCREQLLNVFGVLATYFIVLVQFQQTQPDTSCECPLNSTAAIW